MGESKGSWGGARRGSGRRPEAGAVRRNRIQVTLTDSELEKLREFADGQEQPLGTAARELILRGLKRRR